MNFILKTIFMNWSEYLILFEDILNGVINDPPYDQSDYKQYVKLNYSRVKRWNKSFEPGTEIRELSPVADSQEHWILITEPWCADAANIAPMIHKIAEVLPFVTLDIQLRDSPPFLIEKYLTNGSKSIPKLIARDEAGEDLFVWGPRPQPCQNRVIEMKGTGTAPTDIKTSVQLWYNDDRGLSLQQELINKMLSCPIKRRN